jgi:hypothetical protein
MTSPPTPPSAAETLAEPASRRISTLVQPGGGSFSLGVGPRAALGMSFVLATLLLCYLIEHVPLPTTIPRTAARSSVPGVAGSLRLQSTFAVKRWSVSVDGRPLDPSRSDATSWQGPCQAGQALLVQAAPEDDADTQLHALQLQLTSASTTRDCALWGNGAVIGSITLATSTP